MSPSPLDQPANSSFAWARFRRIMRWCGLVSLGLALGVAGLLWQQFGLVSIHLYIAAVLGVWFTAMMTAALMSLLFLSSGTGHDEAVRDFEPDDS